MTIALDPERHSALIASMRLAASNIQAELDQLNEDTRLLRAQWSGEALRAYGEAQGKWTTSLGALRELLSSATATAQAAGDRLTQAENDAQRVWG